MPAGQHAQPIFARIYSKIRTWRDNQICAVFGKWKLRVFFSKSPKVFHKDFHSFARCLMGIFCSGTKIAAKALPHAHPLMEQLLKSKSQRPNRSLGFPGWNWVERYFFGAVAPAPAGLGAGFGVGAEGAEASAGGAGTPDLAL
jgi:hypothetical protein